MPEKTAEKFLKKSENASGQGFLRFQILGILLNTRQHLTVSGIQQKLIDDYQQYATRQLIGRIVEEISISFKTHRLSEITVFAGSKSRATAYLLIKKIKKNV